MKRIISSFLSCMMILASINVTIFAEAENVWKNYYVSVDGSDLNVGSKEAPFKILDHARDEIQKVLKGMSGDIIVNVMGDAGIYYLDKPFRLRTEDSGQNGHKVIYRGVPTTTGKMPVVSAGVPITGFTKSEKNPNLWQAKVKDDDLEQIRQLYVNDKKSYMAMGTSEITAIDYYREKGSPYASDGMYMSKDIIGTYENSEDVEFQWTVNWKFCSALVKSLEEDPLNPNRIIARMQQGWWDWQSGKGENGLSMRPERPFFVVNAMELLDSPGEYYFNRKTRMIYYMPRAEEDMTTATVIAPKLDKIISFVGNDIDERIKNITVEGLELAHTSFNGPGEGGYENAQATVVYFNQGTVSQTHGGVFLNMADNIEFRGNKFFGMAECGLDMYNAVDNTIVEGNVFTDIGDCAIVIGSTRHADAYTVNGIDSVDGLAPKTGDINLIDGTKRMWGSFFGPPLQTGFEALKGRVSWVPNEQYNYTDTWTGAPDAVAKGEKTWIKYDFDDEFTVNRIRLAFDPSKVTAPEKTGYEVLLSNDKQFREGNYVTVAKQTKTPGNFQEYQVTDETKYRYMIIRTLDSTVFKLSGVWAFSPDRRPYTMNQRCKDITVSNNYLRRVGESQHSAGGIMYYYTENTKILHNEVIDIPYSGIMWGWGWDRQPDGSYNNEISYNYVDHSSLSIHDGGSFYSLGYQPGTKVYGNYSNNDIAGSGAYYLDMSSNYMDFKDNVATNSTKFYMANVEFADNKLDNFYANNTLFACWSATHPKVTAILTSNPPAKAKEVMVNAGLEPEYEYIRGCANDEPIRLVQEEYRLRRTLDFTIGHLESHLKTATSEAANMFLANGSFGDAPGQYPLKYKYKVQNALAEVGRSSADVRVRGTKSYRLKYAIMDADKEFNRTDLKTTIAKSEEVLDKAKKLLSDVDLAGFDTPTILAGAKSFDKRFGVYPKDAVKTFEVKVAAAKAKSTKEMTFQQEYIELQNLEKDYQAFENSKLTADLAYVNAEDMLDCVIDKENKIATVIFPYTINLMDKRIVEFEASKGATIATSAREMSFDKEFKVPVYNKTLNKYIMWTVKGQYEGKGGPEWVNKSATEDSTVKTVAGTYLAPRIYTHMNTTPMMAAETKSISFTTSDITDTTSLSFKFGVGSAKDYDDTSDCTKDNHYELAIVKDKAQLYTIVKGNKTLLKGDIDVKAIERDEVNKFAFKMTLEGNGVRVEVWQDDLQIVNCISNAKISQGYFGIFTEKTGVTIVDLNSTLRKLQ